MQAFDESTSKQSASSHYREEAIPFIIYNPDSNKFELTDESVEFLKHVPGPIGLVAVAGMYRTGKSYLLNRMLLNRSSGFGVGPSINPCTKGLWIWGKPVSGFTPEGEPINVLIVDTEGLGALDEDSNHDVRIFSFAILLSSYFLYNSVGSIDESALSNLSLVINLTKHIQIKARGGCTEDLDTEEYAQYFPSFMWVVRDFTLQLVDSEGEPLTSKEYLEKALDMQKGFSDNVEQKNRIRRLLKSFFKERDCCTMIRPLTNEENLQNLVSMELDELRADFVDQVMQLRRKVLNRIKPKMINNKPLSGSMMSTMAQSYVLAINNGAVPNIENAWNYICKNECVKAMEESMNKFDEVLRDGVFSRIPMEEEELKEIWKQAKDEAVKLFRKKAVGSVADDFIKDMKQKMKDIYHSIKEDNDRESAHQAQMFLENSYSFIEKKLKSKEFTSYTEYEQDLAAFQQYFMDNGPPGPFKRLMLMEFCQNVMSEAAEFWTKQLSNEIEIQKQIQSEHYRNLENNVKELKNDFTREKTQFETKLRNAEVEKAELSAIEQSLRESIERLTSDKKALELDTAHKLETQRKEFLREIEDSRTKMQSTENHAAEMQRKVLTSESEHEKEKALLEQKIEFLEKNIAEYQMKENEYAVEIKNQKKEHQNYAREIQQKYEQQIKSLSHKLDEMTEKYHDLTSQFEELESKYTYEKKEWTDSQEHLKSNMSVSQSQFSEMNKTLEDLKSKSKAEVEKLIQELNDIKEQNKMKEDELEDSLKEKEEEIKQIKNRFDKEMAIYKQKLEFKDVQISQLKNQVDESRKTHDSMVKAMENRAKESNDGKEMAFKQVEELKEIHTQEVRELEKEYSEARQRLEAQIDSLNIKNNDLELNYKLLKTEYDKEVDSLRSQLEQSDLQKQRALDQSKNIDSQKLRLLEETEERHKLQIIQLEKELEEREFKAESELRDLQVKSEEALAQLKNFYEIEKERLEHRIAEEKERAVKKLNQQQEEFDALLRDERQMHEEDTEMLQEELREKERKFLSYQNQMEHESILMKQRLETLELQMKEKDDRYNREQSMNANQLDCQFERFNTERKEMLAKIENLSGSMSGKDREITILKSKLEGALEDVEKKKKQFEDYKLEFQSEKEKLNDKIEQQRTKNQEISDEFIQKKLEDARELALYKQKLEFQQKKIEDLTKNMEEQIGKYEEKIQQQKTDYHQEMQDSYLKLNNTKEQLESKFEKKRREFKEQEVFYQKQLTEIQKEKAVMEEKLLHADSRLYEVKSKLEQELESLSNQLGQANEQIGKDREVFVHESERLKVALQDMEKEYCEMQSAYERDKALWDGKFQFLEQQKELAKSDLQEATRKFEMTLEQLQKRGSAEKDKIELSQNAILNTLEQKYKSQLKEQIEGNQRLISELNEKNKMLEKENRQLQNRLQLEQRDKMTDHGTMEKKVCELIENESRLHKEIDELKQERDKKIVENQRNLEKEREIFKQRLNDIEQKCKELENKRSSMIFEIEKERAKWGLERDHLVAQKQEVQEQLDRIQRRQELLLRENEKLKNERNSRKQMMYGVTGGRDNAGLPSAGAGYASKFTPQMFGSTLAKSLTSKENMVSSSQAFPSGFSKFISDGSSLQQEKPDPQQLPLASKDSNNKLSQFGSPKQMQFLSTKNIAGSVSGGSSGAGSFKNGAKGGSSTDETNSNC